MTTIVLNRTTASQQREMDDTKRKAKSEIDAFAGEVRCSYITPIPGQEMTYKEKEEEAKAFLAADPEPTDLTPYPFLAAEVGVTGTTAFQVATIIMYMSDQWRIVGPMIEGLRVQYKALIDGATTQTEVEQFLANGLEDLEELK